VYTLCLHCIVHAQVEPQRIAVFSEALAKIQLQAQGPPITMTAAATPATTAAATAAAAAASTNTELHILTRAPLTLHSLHSVAAGSSSSGGTSTSIELVGDMYGDVGADSALTSLPGGTVVIAVPEGGEAGVLLVVAAPAAAAAATAVKSIALPPDATLQSRRRGDAHIEVLYLIYLILFEQQSRCFR
jgi:hypothetical protein